MKSLLIFLMLGFVVSFFPGCKNDTDPCNDLTCMNGGMCNNGVCDCPPFFTGSSCETATISLYSGSTYKGKLTQDNTLDLSVKRNFIFDPNQPSQLVNFEDEYVMDFISNTAFVINQQVIDVGLLKVRYFDGMGEFYANGDSIRMAYKQQVMPLFADPIDEENWTFVGGL